MPWSSAESVAHDRQAYKAGKKTMPKNLDNLPPGPKTSGLFDQTQGLSKRPAKQSLKRSAKR